MIQLKLSKQGMREGVALNLPATPAEVSEACAWFDRLGIPQNEPFPSITQQIELGGM